MTPLISTAKNALFRQKSSSFGFRVGRTNLRFGAERARRFGADRCFVGAETLQVIGARPVCDNASARTVSATWRGSSRSDSV
jgi:hypothetical protein